MANALVEAGAEPSTARADARLGVAVVRGLLLDLLATGERREVDEAFERYLQLTELTTDVPRAVSFPMAPQAPPDPDPGTAGGGGRMNGQGRDAGRVPPDPDRRLDRRQFLRRGGSTAAALGAAALLGPLAGCSKTSSTAGPTTTVPRARRAPRQPPLPPPDRRSGRPCRPC